jgi:hypothetical protein
VSADKKWRRLCLEKYPTQNRFRRVGKFVEHHSYKPSKHKAMSSSPSSTKKGKQKKLTTAEGGIELRQDGVYPEMHPGQSYFNFSFPCY